MLYPKGKLCSVTTAEVKCLLVMVNMIKYTLVADIIDYFTNVSKISGPIKCNSMVTSDCHESWVLRFSLH
jgi:hypothetical protein